MIDGSGTLKVTDFGLAKTIGVEGSERDNLHHVLGAPELTKVGAVCGTPPFMAPEQFIDSRTVDFQADIYSFGVVLYLMISGGAAPISAEQENRGGLSPIGAWAVAHFRQPVTPRESPLMAICMRCLEKNPAHRFQFYAEIIQDLRQVCRQYCLIEPQEMTEPLAEMEGHLVRARALVETGQNELALVELRSMARNWPEIAKIQTEICRANLVLGRLEEAKDAIECSLKIDNSRTAAWNNLGVVFARMNRLQEAKNAFGQALLIEPENTGAMISMAQLLLEEGNLREAREVADLAVFWRPEKVNALKIAGICALKSGDTRSAESIFLKLVSVDGNNSRDWFNLAICYRAHQNTEKEIQVLQSVLKMAPKNTEALNFLIDAYNSVSRFDEALRTSLELQRVPGWELVGTCKAAQMLSAKGETLEGYELLKRWLRRNEHNASLWLTVASILCELPAYREEAKSGPKTRGPATYKILGN